MRVTEKPITTDSYAAPPDLPPPLDERIIREKLAEEFQTEMEQGYENSREAVATEPLASSIGQILATHTPFSGQTSSVATEPDKTLQIASKLPYVRDLPALYQRSFVWGLLGGLLAITIFGLIMMTVA